MFFLKIHDTLPPLKRHNIYKLIKYSSYSTTNLYMYTDKISAQPHIYICYVNIFQLHEFIFTVGA